MLSCHYPDRGRRRNALKNMGPVHSVDKALTLVEILLRRRAPMKLSEIACVSGYPKSTVHALLSTLREHSMVEQMQDGKYFLGIRLFECGCAVSSSWDVAAKARAHLERLAAETGASAFLASLNGRDAVIIDQRAGGSSLCVVSETGSAMPLHCTSQGKLLLSQYTDASVRGILADMGMQPYTPHTITDPDVFIEKLHEIRALGYSVEDGEYRIGLRSVSAPIYSSDGSLRYALGVIGLFRRVDSEEFKKVTEQTAFVAGQLSWELGWRGKDVRIRI